MADPSWGPAWPDCQTDLIVDLDVDGTRFPGGVRVELHELLTRLVRETRTRGYTFGTPDDPSYGCWGFSCRSISGSSAPSNHSCGLAVDINAPWNPQRTPLTTDMPAWMPDLWNGYGFRWGGDYSGTPDAMHYEYMRSVDDAAADTDRARRDRIGEPGGSGGIEGMIGVIFGSPWDAQLWFVRSMYQEMLGREPSAQELNDWARHVAIGAADGGAVADSMRAFFFDTPEGQNAQRDGLGYWSKRT